MPPGKDPYHPARLPQELALELEEEKGIEKERPLIEKYEEEFNERGNCIIFQIPSRFYLKKDLTGSSPSMTSRRPFP
jgi:hypothetical protein